MNKWMRRRIDHLRSELQKQEQQLNVAKDRNNLDEVERLERQVATTKGEMVRVIST